MPPRSRLIRQARPGERPVVVPYGIRLAAEWTWRLAVIATGVWGLLYVIALFQVIVVPLLVAVLVTALLLPIVNRLHNVGVPRAIGAGVSLVATIAVVAGLISIVWAQVTVGFGDLEKQAIAGWEQIQAWFAEGPLGLTTDQIDDFLNTASEQVAANQDQLISGALQFTSTAGHLIAGLFLALFAIFFLLLDGERIWNWAVRILPVDAHESADMAGRRAWISLTAYVRAVIVVAFVDAVGIGVGAALLGVPLAVPLALLVFLGAFVPIVGAFVSGSVAVLVALVANGPVNALLMLAVVIGVQQAESHILQPLLLGRAVRVHPLGVLVAIAGGILIAGVVGALFAVPLVAVLNTVVVSLRRRDELITVEPEPDDSDTANDTWSDEDDAEPLHDETVAKPGPETAP